MYLTADLTHVHAFFRGKGVQVMGENGEGFVKMVYVKGEGEEEKAKVGEEKLREVLEKLIEGESWEEVRKGMKGVFSDQGRREREEEDDFEEEEEEKEEVVEEGGGV